MQSVDPAEARDGLQPEAGPVAYWSEQQGRAWDFSKVSKAIRWDPNWDMPWPQMASVGPWESTAEQEQTETSDVRVDEIEVVGVVRERVQQLGRHARTKLRLQRRGLRRAAADDGVHGRLIDAEDGASTSTSASASASGPRTQPSG